MRTYDLLNVGYDRTIGQSVTPDQRTYAEWIGKGLRGDHSLICLYCHQAGRDVPLVVCHRVGGHRRMYFRHPPGAARGAHSPETVWHVDGKRLIARWALSQPNVAGVEPECWTDDRSRRADVLVTLASGARIAVELQTRALTDADWTARHRDYAERNIVDVWLWHPTVERHGILLHEQVGVWYLDVARSSLGILLGKPPAECVFALHHPPRPTDRTLCKWYPLSESALHDGGLQLPAALTTELHAARKRVYPASPTQDAPPSTAATYVAPPAHVLRHLHRYLVNDLGVTGDIRFKGRSSAMANGFPVYADGRLIGVACPNPDDSAAWRSLKTLTVFAAANQTRWISRAAPLGTRLRIIRTE